MFFNYVQKAIYSNVPIPEGGDDGPWGLEWEEDDGSLVLGNLEYGEMKI